MQSLLLLQSLSNVLFSLIVLWWQGVSASVPRRLLPLHSLVAVSYCGGMLSANISLSHILYAEQVLLKSTKPIAVLLALALRTTVPVRRWMAAGAVTLGALVFMQQEMQFDSSRSDDTVDSPTFGRLCVLGSLACDAITALQQDAITRKQALDDRNGKNKGDLEHRQTGEQLFSG